MQVVLLEKIERLGKMGDVVNVKPGYARNFLLPRKKALRATEANIAYFEKERAVLETHSKDQEVKAEGFKKKIEGQAVIIIRQSSEAGNLYGSVTAKDIADAFHDKVSSLTRHHIVLDAPLKAAGVHSVTVRLHPEVSTKVIVSIAPSEEEAKNQLIKKEEPKAKEESASTTSAPNADVPEKKAKGKKKGSEEETSEE